VQERSVSLFVCLMVCLCSNWRYVREDVCLSCFLGLYLLLSKVPEVGWSQLLIGNTTTSRVGRLKRYP
jgi:hypothetical protein